MFLPWTKHLWLPSAVCINNVDMPTISLRCLNLSMIIFLQNLAHRCAFHILPVWGVSATPRPFSRAWGWFMWVNVIRKKLSINIFYSHQFFRELTRINAALVLIRYGTSAIELKLWHIQHGMYEKIVIRNHRYHSIFIKWWGVTETYAFPKVYEAAKLANPGKWNLVSSKFSRIDRLTVGRVIRSLAFNV
jgi:hypothetical protein